MERGRNPLRQKFLLPDIHVEKYDQKVELIIAHEFKNDRIGTDEENCTMTIFL